MKFKANGTAIKSARIEVELANGVRWTYELVGSDTTPAAVWVNDQPAPWATTGMPSGNTLLMPTAEPDALELKLTGSKVRARLVSPSGQELAA